MRITRISRLFVWFAVLIHTTCANWTSKPAVNDTEWNAFFRPGLRAVSSYPLETIKKLDFLNSALNRTLPTAVDWRHTFGPVRSQGKCGSCWAFAGVGAVESALARKNPPQVYDLSEQQMMDCSNMGCRGATLSSTLIYLRKNALCPESLRPYIARENRSRLACTQLHRLRLFPRVRQIKTFLGETVLQKALVSGPLIVAIHANALFYSYSSGVFDGVCTGIPNHAVLLVGYNRTATGVPYWLIRNSWGSDWGEQGYIRMIRGRYQCKLGLSRSYQIGI